MVRSSIEIDVAATAAFGAPARTQLAFGGLRFATTANSPETIFANAAPLTVIAGSPRLTCYRMCASPLVRAKAAH